MYKLSPSKAHRYLQCTKSLEFDTEFVETPYTIRGSLLHNLAELFIKNENVDTFLEEHSITEYEHYLITSYVNAVWQEYELIGAKEIHVEEKTGITIYDNDINLIIDTLVLGKDTASIIDLKTGNNDIHAEDNEQLLFYAFSVITKYPQVNHFRLSIFQKGKLKTTEVTKSEVLDFFVSKEQTFAKIKLNQLEYNPSDKACKYCSIRDTCVARAKWIIGGKKT